jgi:hypothetical protein
VVFDAIRQLMAPPPEDVARSRRRIGFHVEHQSLPEAIDHAVPARRRLRAAARRARQRGNDPIIFSCIGTDLSP